MNKKIIFHLWSTPSFYYGIYTSDLPARTSGSPPGSHSCLQSGITGGDRVGRGTVMDHLSGLGSTREPSGSSMMSSASSGQRAAARCPELPLGTARDPKTGSRRAHTSAKTAPPWGPPPAPSPHLGGSVLQSGRLIIIQHDAWVLRPGKAIPMDF